MICKWGEPGSTLLPEALRRKWAEEAMPRWLCEELRLPIGSTFARLDTTIWERTTAVSDRVLTVLANLLRARVREIWAVPLVQPAVQQESISISGESLSTRSRNSLQAEGLLANPENLAHMTIGDLLKIPALGTRSALEIACITEASVIARADAFQQIAVASISQSIPDWTQRLNEAARKSWASSISERDLRFQGILPEDDEGTVIERIERLLAEPDSIASLVRGPKLAASLERLEASVNRFDLLSLDEALYELLVSSSRKRRNQIEALSVRFGWSGELPKTLEESAAPLGITRERVRQIESKFLAGLPADVYMPQLDSAIEMLERSAPITPPFAQDLLIHSHICKHPFAPESLLLAAEIFKRQTDLRIEDVRSGGRLIVGSRSSVRGVANTARKLAGMAGVASVFQVVATGNEISNPEETRRILQGLTNIEFLNEDWFWVTDIPVRRNRLSNIAKKILSVAAPQSVQSIRDGVRRAFTYRSKSATRYENLVTPPSEVLSAFFRHSPEFKISDAGVGPAHPLSYLRELGDIDRALVEVFRSTSAGVLDRRSVFEACAVRGMNENSVSLFLTYSPIIEHAGIDIWKLRGVRVDPAAIEALREANENAPLEKRLLSFGWRADGKLWIASRLPYSLTSFVGSLPGTLKRYLTDRKFAAVDRISGTACGQITVNDEGSSFGYSMFFRVSGAEPGDVMLSEFDLATESVALSHTDESVLEEDYLA